LPLGGMWDYKATGYWYGIDCFLKITKEKKGETD